MIAAVIDKTTKEVINIIVANARTDPPPSDDVYLVNVDGLDVDMGYVFDEKTLKFSRSPKEIEAEEKQLQEWIDQQWVEA